MAGGQERELGTGGETSSEGIRPEGGQLQHTRQPEGTRTPEVAQLAAIRNRLTTEQQGQPSPSNSDSVTWSGKKKFWHPLGYAAYLASGAIFGGGIGILAGAVLGACAIVPLGLTESVFMGSLAAGFGALLGALPFAIGAVAVVGGFIGVNIGIDRALAEFHRGFDRKKKR